MIVSFIIVIFLFIFGLIVDVMGVKKKWIGFFVVI